MVFLQPNRRLLLEGIDSATQKVLESNDEECYGYISSETSDNNLDENSRDNDNGSEVSD